MLLFSRHTWCSVMYRSIHAYHLFPFFQQAVHCFFHDSLVGAPHEAQLPGPVELFLSFQHGVHNVFHASSSFLLHVPHTPPGVSDRPVRVLTGLSFIQHGVHNCFHSASVTPPHFLHLPSTGILQSLHTVIQSSSSGLMAISKQLVHFLKYFLYTPKHRPHIVPLLHATPQPLHIVVPELCDVGSISLEDIMHLIRLLPKVKYTCFTPSHGTTTASHQGHIYMDACQMLVNPHQVVIHTDSLVTNSKMRVTALFQSTLSTKA